MPKEYTTIAIAYDFDGTLAKGNIQEDSFLPELGIEKGAFWGEVKELAKDNEMDEILACMYLLLDKAKNKKFPVSKESLKKHGESAQYFKGVEEFFGRINEYAKAKNIKLEHYIISSGTKEMIEGTSIARELKRIFASSFKYNLNGVAEWPALAINYTAKTQYLFRINKGITNAWDNSAINQYMPEEDRPIPFNHIIYLGDGETDIPAMKMINYQGGTSIAVYPPDERGARDKAEKLLEEKRATYVAMADYSENGDIDLIIKSIIDQISAQASIKKFSKIKKSSSSKNTGK